MAADRRHSPYDSNRGKLRPLAALSVVTGVLVAAGLIARKYSPDPTHPRIRRWYKSLDKPAYKPPDPVFGAAWPVLQTLHSYGAYRLMQSPSSPQRDAAIALWLVDIALVTGWAKLFFGERSLTGASLESALLVASAAGFMERASHVDGVAAATAAPFALWSAFGGLMTEDLRERNPDLDGERRRLAES